MCVKVALCLALIVSIEARVVKFGEVPTNNKDDHHQISNLKNNIGESNDIRTLTMEPLEDINMENNEVLSSLSTEHSIDTVAILEDRSGGVIKAGRCPKGYTKINNICKEVDVDSDY